MPKWIERWYVPSSDGDKTYTVARDEEGNFGCDCPAYKYRRQVCRHIQEIKGKVSSERVDTNTAKKLRQWNVPSSSGKKQEYKVTVYDDGRWECSCPDWIYRRAECKHIKMQKAVEEAEASARKNVIGGVVKALPTMQLDNAARLLRVEIPARQMSRSRGRNEALFDKLEEKVADALAKNWQAPKKPAKTHRRRFDFD